jgi:flagellin
MSFSINTNIAAMGALNNVSTTQMALNNSITQLSTGLRINSAADDPSGLIISERFQAQIGGLNQAITNSQDAVNYAKTADGGLGQISSLLNTARSLAVAASNNATLTSSALQADQSELSSIASSITGISQTTQYGTKNLLDGTAGTSASITDGQDVSGINIGGQFGGTALSTGGTITLSSLTSATQATVSSATFAFATSTVAAAGTFAINGTTFTTSTSSTASDVVNMVNAASNQTGVTATYTNGGQIAFTSNEYGSGAKINLSDASGTVLSTAGTTSSTGASALATVTIGSTTVNFTGGSQGTDGLTLTDADGNQINLTQLGNATTLPSAIAIGQVSVGTSQFQIGADAGQTAQLSLGNFAASQLGGGAVSGLNMSNLDLTTASGASNAIQVIDAAINQVSTARGAIGNFQSNVLDVNINQLTTQSQNLQSSESSITDANIAQVMTSYTQQQILEQAGISVLGQANQAPQEILSLIKGG